MARHQVVYRIAPSPPPLPRAALAGLSFDTSGVAKAVVNAFMPALRAQIPSLVDVAMPALQQKIPSLVNVAVPALERQLPGLMQRQAPVLVNSLVPIVKKQVPILLDAAWPSVQAKLSAEIANTIRQNIPFATFAKTYGPALAFALTSVVVGASALTLYRAARDGI